MSSLFKLAVCSVSLPFSNLSFEVILFLFNRSDEEICGNDKMCKQYHQLANNLQYHPYLKHRDVTNMTLNRPSLNIDYSEGGTYTYLRNTIHCQEYFNLPIKFVNQSGFSPWKYVINRDENR